MSSLQAPSGVGVVISANSDCLVSPYPLTSRIVAHLEKVHGFTCSRSLALGDLKRASITNILRVLRSIRCGRLWVVVSEHNFQPYLPLILLLAALTRAHFIQVTDYSGTAYRVARARILIFEPLRLLWGSVRGLLTLLKVRRETERLLRAPLAKTA